MDGWRDDAATCPFCGTSDVMMISPFGKMQLVMQYYCNVCRTVFERIKWREASPVDQTTGQ